MMGLRSGGWRGVPADERVLEWFEREGLRQVAPARDELVVVLVQPTRRIDPARSAQASRDATSFRDFADPGHVKIAPSSNA